MSESKHFMMGEFRADLPDDRLYSKRHLWLKPVAENRYQVGLTSYSVRLLQDVYFLAWNVDEGVMVQDRQEIGEVESSKAVSALFTPCAGRLTSFNQDVLNDPSAINADSYGTGWLYEFETQEPLLDAEQYQQLLVDVWETTQRTIKGQMN